MSAPFANLVQPPKDKRGEFVMTVGKGRISVHAGNLTAGELMWLGELAGLMCDPARAREWAAVKAQQRVLTYTQGALEVVRPQALCSSKAN